MRTIDIETRFLTLIGTPLGQSYAARMQNASFAAAGLNIRYFYTETGAEHLGEIINGLRHMPSFLGCAVTKPNKVAVCACLDELDPLCAKMEACNTVVRTGDGRLVGYNTDGAGFYQSIRDRIQVEGGTFFCIGAGGAGRAICSTLAHYHAERIYVTDLFADSTRQLRDDLVRNFSASVEAVPFGDFEAASECGMLINASGVGMGATIGQTPIPRERIRPGQLCFDACYNPEKTQFLLDAEERGCPVLNGLDMSLYQGAAQFELWTGRPAPIDVMRRELKQILKERAEA